MTFKRKRAVHIKPFIPNIITIFSLCAGLTSIRLAFEHKWELAIIAILFAAIMDFLDGGVARFLQVKSKMGAQLDSLADLISFGVAPTFCVYHFALYANVRIGWAAALYFAVCMALRLARFNATFTSEKPQNFFIGMPAPAGGLAILIPIFLYLETGWYIFQSFILNSALVWITGMLLISHIPTFSFKNIKVPPKKLHLFILYFLLFTVFLYSHPWLMLGLMGIAVLFSIPVSYYYYKNFLDNIE